LIKSYLVQVKGRVQGVGFRYSALNKARSLHLRGWVRNEVDGSVSARFEGPDEAVSAYLVWLKTGPPSSIVKNTIVSEMSLDDNLEQFHVEF